MTFTKDILNNENKDYLKNTIDNNIEEYLNKIKQSFSQKILYSSWLEKYIRKLKRLGYFKTFETFSSHSLINRK